MPKREVFLCDGRAASVEDSELPTPASGLCSHFRTLSISLGISSIVRAGSQSEKEGEKTCEMLCKTVKRGCVRAKPGREGAEFYVWVAPISRLEAACGCATVSGRLACSLHNVGDVSDPRGSRASLTAVC